MTKYASFRIEEWEAFVKTAELGSFSAASRRLNRAQSVISTQVANLESNLGYQLFDRRHKPILTERGEIILAEAKNLISRSENLSKHARELAWEKKPRIFIGMDLSLDPKVIAKLLTQFSQSHPTIQIQIENFSSFDSNWFFKNTHMDMALIYTHETSTHYAEHILKVIPSIVVVGKNHELAQKNTISSDDLANTRQIVVTARDQYSPKPRIYSEDHWEVNSPSWALHLACQNLGWTVVAESVLKEIPHWKNNLTILNKIPLTIPAERLVFRWKEGELEDSIVSWFIENLQRIRI